MEVSVPVAFGELVDKITILELKFARIGDPVKREHVREELKALLGITGLREKFALAAIAELSAELRTINAAIWDAEETVRACEAHGDFGLRFIEAARSIYQHNDRRATVKRQVNLLSGSALVEEKSY